MEKKRFLEGDNKRFCVVSRLLCFFCLFIGIYACQVDEDGVVNKGTLAFRMNVDTALVGVSTKASDLVDFKDVNSYAVTIAQDSGVVAEYSRFDKMPAELELGAGAYTIQVSKGTETAAAFDAPYFSGKKEFTIVKDMTTPVEVTAAMANSRVTIDYSDDFLQTYKDYTLSLKTNKMELPLVYEKGESRPMYFLSDASGTKLEIAMELVNIYGKTVNYMATTTIKPKQWAKLTVRTDEKGLNGIAIDVTLNDETKETIYVNIGIPDFMEKLKGAPFIDNAYFSWADSTNMKTPYKLKPIDAGKFKNISNVSVYAGRKIKQAVLRVTKDETTILNIDFANLSEEEKEELETKYAFGLPEKIKGEINFEFSVLDLLNSLLPVKNKQAEYLITLAVTDVLGRTTNKLVTAILKEPKVPSFGSLSSIEGTYQQFSSQKSLMISPKLDLVSCSFILKNSAEEIVEKGNVDIETGTTGVDGIVWRKSSSFYYLDITKEWLNSLSSGVFTMTVTVTDIIGMEASKDIKISVAAIEWLTTESDVFATYLTLKAKALDKDISSVKFIYEGNVIGGEQFNDEGDGIVSFKLKKLTPNKKCEVIVEHKGIQLKKSWYTEKAAQLTNAGFEDWHYTRPDNVKYWEVYYPWAEKGTSCWNTMNLLTTSEGGTNTTILNRDGCRYSANSGTLSTKDANSGNLAALIRTVGWGSGNSAAATSWGDGMGTCEKLTPGELYLGTYDVSTHTPSYFGYAFTSRPSAISFAYKYQPKNSSDWGVVEIEIKDNEDQTLVKKEEKLYSQSSYVVKEIRLDYSLASKAAKIYMKFKSSGNSECWEINSTNLTPPPARNLSDGEYVGSQLYIDDVELIYDYQE